MPEAKIPTGHKAYVRQQSQRFFVPKKLARTGGRKRPITSQAPTLSKMREAKGLRRVNLKTAKHPA